MFLVPVEAHSNRCGFAPLAASFSQRGPAKQLLVILIRHLGIGDRDLALQRGEALLLAGIVGLGNLLVELLVDGAIDAADEEARDAGDMRGIAASGDVFFESRDVGLRHRAIDGLREQQRDVDRHAFCGQRLDRRQAFPGRRHLHHQILALDVLPQPLGLRDRALGVVGEIGRHFQADKAVAALGGVINRPQHVGGILDVLDRDGLEQIGHRAVALLQRLGNRGVIFVGTADRLFEDRGVGGDALHPVGVDQLLQVALGDEAAGEEVEPDRLAMGFECFDGVHGACFCLILRPEEAAFRRAAFGPEGGKSTGAGGEPGRFGADFAGITPGKCG